jgi:elongation factor Tu
MVLCKPGSIKEHTKFEAKIYLLSKEEGGRHTAILNNYQPQFFFRTADVIGIIKLFTSDAGDEDVMAIPGHAINIQVN